MSPPLNSQPAVTFALVSFNQADFIRDAMLAALSQTYQPLRILCSDDASSDSTFEIIERMSAEYRGPHSVTVHRNSKNLGLIEHVNQIFERAGSEIVVLAAGDDISAPERTELIVRRFMEADRPWAVHSCVTMIDRCGHSLGDWRPPVECRNMTVREIAVSNSIHIGASAAYRTSLVESFGRLTERLACEDLVLGFRAALRGGLAFIDEPLVRYRAGIGISSVPPIRTSREYLREHMRRLDCFAATLRQRLADCASIGANDVVTDIHDALAETDARIALHSEPFTLPSRLLRGPLGRTSRGIVAETFTCAKSLLPASVRNVYRTFGQSRGR